MQVTLRTPWPEWLLHCTDDDLIAVCGGGSVARGALYAKKKAVRTLVCDDDELEAVVSGSGGRVYETSVSGGVYDGEVEVGGECSCPMDVDCKHVVAVVLTARRLARAAAPGSGGASVSAVPHVLLIFRAGREDRREAAVRPTAR